MTRKHLKLIAVLLGIAALLYLPRLLSDDDGRGSLSVDEGFSIAIAEPLTRIDIIHLETGDTVSLERGVEEWTVAGLRADQAKIQSLLGVVSDLASDALVARNPDNHGSLGVSEDTGRRIEIYSEGGGPESFHLGNRDLSTGGYFVRHAGVDDVFRLESPAAGYLSRDRDGWRQRMITSLDEASLRDIVIRRGDGETVLRLTDGAWTVDGMPADSAVLQRLLSVLPTLSVSGFPSDEQAASTDFSAPEAELDVFAEGGDDVTDRELVLALRFVQDVEAGDWLVRLADGDEVYRLAAFTVRRLLPEPAALRGEDGGG